MPMNKPVKQYLAKRDRMQLARAAILAIEDGMLDHKFASAEAKQAVLADLIAFTNNEISDFYRMLVEGDDGRWEAEDRR